jgi:bifunctional DNase/RNase
VAQQAFQGRFRFSKITVVSHRTNGSKPFRAKGSFELPNLQTFQFDESSAVELRIERAETVKLFGDTDVHVLYLARTKIAGADEDSQPASPKSFREDEERISAFFTRPGDFQTGRAETGSKGGKLLPLFLADKLEKDMIVSGIVSANPTAIPAEKAKIDVASLQPGNMRHRLSLARFFWRNRDVLVEAQRIQSIMQGQGNRSRRSLNMLRYVTDRILQSRAVGKAHEMLLEILREELKCTVLQVVLSPVAQNNLDQLRAYVCLETKGPQRQPWFVRMRASDGAVLAFRAGCRLFIQRDVWEYAAINTNSIPLGDSVVFPLRNEF